MLGTGRGSAQLSLRLDEAHLHVDSLIFEGAHRGAHAALVSIGSHYDGVDFIVIRRWRTLGRSKGDIRAIESAAAPGAEARASRVSAASVRRQLQSSGVKDFVLDI